MTATGKLKLSLFVVTTLSLCACNSEEAQFSGVQTASKVSLTVESAEGVEKPKEAVPVSTMNGSQVDDVFATLEEEDDGTVAGSGGAEGAKDGDDADSDGGDKTDGASGSSDGGDKDSTNDSTNDDGVADSDTDGADSANTDSANTDSDSATSNDDEVATTDESKPASPAKDDETTTDSSNSGTENTAAEPADTETADFEAPSAAELKACSSLTGVSVDKIITASSDGDSIKSYSVVAMRLTGKGKDVELDLAGAVSGAVLRGLCVFVAGSENVVTVTLGLTVQSLVYVGRGDQTKGNIAVVDEGAVEAGAANLRGHLVELAATGLGGGCDKIKVSGDSSGFSCN